MTKMLKEVLQEKLEVDELDKLCSSFDIIGNIAIIKIPETLSSKKKLIADTLIEEIKVIKTVFCQVSGIEGNYRLRKLELLSGENTSNTVYRNTDVLLK